MSLFITNSGFNADNKNLFCRKKASICRAKSINRKVVCSTSTFVSSLSGFGDVSSLVRTLRQDYKKYKSYKFLIILSSYTKHYIAAKRYKMGNMRSSRFKKKKKRLIISKNGGQSRSKLDWCNLCKAGFR